MSIVEDAFETLDAAPAQDRAAARESARGRRRTAGDRAALEAVPARLERQRR